MAGLGAEPLLQQAGAAVSSLIVFQLFSRIVTFVLNTAILRLASPLTLGIAAVRLDLFMTTVLFLARDGMRMALLRFPPPQKALESRSVSEWTRKFVNMCWVSFPVGVAVAVVLGFVFGALPPGELGDGGQFAGLRNLYVLAIVVYAFAAVVELACEPFNMLFMYNQNYRLRISVEGVSVVLRAGFTVAAVLFCEHFLLADDDLGLKHAKIGLYVFPLAQLVHSISLLVAFAVTFWKHDEFAQMSLFDLCPHWPFIIDRPTLSLTYDLSKQLALRYVLSQGDMWLVSIFSKVHSQGVYAVVSNYGSLVCRLLLQPIEESSLLFFSRTLGMSTRTRLITSSDELKGSTLEPAKVRAALLYLCVVLKFDFMLSMFFTCFAPFYTKTLIRLVLGTAWSSTQLPIVLSLYCLMIPVLAFNGILEAFMHATISRRWLRISQITLVVFSLVYIGVAVPLVQRYDCAGLIVAGTLGFGLRTVQGALYLWQFVVGLRLDQELDFADIFPRTRCNLAFIGAAYICSRSALYNGSEVLHVVIGVVLAGAVSVLLWRSEREFFRHLYDIFIAQKHKDL